MALEAAPGAGCAGRNVSCAHAPRLRSQPGSAARTLSPRASSRDEQLRRKIDEFIGVTFFGTLLKVMRDSRLKGEYGHGGRGEEIFRAQLDAELAQRAGRGLRSGLNEAIYRQLSRWGRPVAGNQADGAIPAGQSRAE